MKRGILLPTREARLNFFMETPVNKRGFLLLESPQGVREEILETMKTRDIVNMLHYLDPDEATDLLQSIAERKRDKILDKLTKNIREKVGFLLKFDPNTAAGIMSLNYVEVDSSISRSGLSRIIKRHEKRTGRIPTILLVEEGYLKGEIPIYALGAYKTKKIAKHAKNIPSIRFDKETKEVLEIFKRNPHNKIVVLDDDESILGIIYSDDILRLMESQKGKSLYDFTGVREEESITDGALAKVRNRYGWLIVNLATAFFAASVVGLFQESISKFVLLAVYMPIVAGMGGNAGSQALAVTIRGLALREISLATAKQAILNEMIAGLVNGLITGLIAALIAILWNQSAILGFIVCIAMISNLIIAGLFGSIIPLIFKELGKDPASSATVFITTATDVFGFFIFLGMASWLLG